MSGNGFPSLLQDLSSQKDCTNIVATQKNTLRKYEETNEMLRQFLILSEATHKVLLEKFLSHSKTLSTLKKDLENCFKRIRILKSKLLAKHPEAFEATADAIKKLQEQYDLESNEQYQYNEENRSTGKDGDCEEEHEESLVSGVSNSEKECPVAEQCDQENDEHSFVSSANNESIGETETVCDAPNGDEVKADSESSDP